jgi:hypothetical protein
MLGGRNKMKKYKLGDKIKIPGKEGETITNNFEETNRLRTEAHIILDKCIKADQANWENILKIKPGLEKYNMQWSSEKNEIKIVGFKRE